MTPDERLNGIEQGWNTPYDCRVCIGLSPSWDGHDRSCRGRVWESVPWLIGQLRDARAENERLNLVVAAMDSQADENITEVLALTADRDHWRTEREDADVKRITAEAELAAERAKAERVEALCDEYRTNCDPDTKQAQVAEMFRAALAGGEKE